MLPQCKRNRLRCCTPRRIDRDVYRSYRPSSIQYHPASRQRRQCQYAQKRQNMRLCDLPNKYSLSRFNGDPPTFVVAFAAVPLHAEPYTEPTVVVIPRTICRSEQIKFIHLTRYHLNASTTHQPAPLHIPQWLLSRWSRQDRQYGNVMGR